MRPERNARAINAALVLAGLIGLAACSSMPPPRAEIGAAEVRVAAAEEAGAASFAPGPLALARDKVAQARAAIDREDHVTARRLARRALVDAERAEAEARAETARRELANLQDSIDILRQEIERDRGR